MCCRNGLNKGLRHVQENFSAAASHLMICQVLRSFAFGFVAAISFGRLELVFLLQKPDGKRDVARIFASS